MTDDDITAFRPAAVPPAAPAVRPRRRLWRWLLVGTVLLMALTLTVMLAAGAALASLADWIGSGLHVTIDGDSVQLGGWGGDWDGWRNWSDGPGLLALGGVLLVILLALCLVPVAVVLGLCAAALGVGIALLAALTAVAAALSPLWIIVLLGWLLLRPRRSAPA